MKIDLQRAVEVLSACGYECEELYATHNSFQAGAASRDAEIQRLQFALADSEALELGTAERCDQLRVQINKLREALGKHVTELMNIAVSNGANSVSMPDDYVATAWLLSETPEQPLPSTGTR